MEEKIVCENTKEDKTIVLGEFGQVPRQPQRRKFYPIFLQEKTILFNTEITKFMKANKEKTMIMKQASMPLEKEKSTHITLASALPKMEATKGRAYFRRPC